VELPSSLTYLPAAAVVGAVPVEALSPVLVTLRTGEGGPDLPPVLEAAATAADAAARWQAGKS